MNNNKKLIIQLLIQDFKHEQLLCGLNKLGFKSEVHDLELSGIVAELMGIPEEEMSWNWFDVYIQFLKQVDQYEITGDGRNLLPLAEACYDSLKTYQLETRN